MAELLGLIVSLIVLLLVLLPILTFIRLGRLGHELAELSRRLAALETASARSDAPETASVTPSTAWPTAVESAVAGAGIAAASTEGPPLVGPQETGPDLEERIGGRGLLYTGVLVILLGVSFFLKYAFDNHWINETARTAIGAFTGISLVAGGLRLARSGLPTFGQALVGTGFAVLYLVVYAALNFYFLIGRGAAFALMIAVTVAAATVAHRERAQALAFIAVGGGFLTPALVGGDVNTQLTLFTYDALLVFATVGLALRHRWPGLNAVSYIGTLVTIVAWAARYYSDEQWLRTLLFLTLFCVAFIIVLRAMRGSHEWTARLVRGLLWTAPAFYHVAAIVIAAGHPPAIHVYLIAATAAGLWFTVEPHRPLPRLVVLLAVVIPMFGTLTLPEGQSWLVANLITIVAVALLHVVALIDRMTRQDEQLETLDLVLLHLTGLALFSLLHETLLPFVPQWRGAIAVGVAATVLGVGRVLRPRDEVAWLNAVALACTLLAIGVAVQFDGAPVVIGWAVEGAALAWLGVRSANRTFQVGGVGLWLLAALQLLDLLTETPIGFTALWNARTMATVFVLVAGYVMAARLSALTTPLGMRMRTVVHVAASVVTMWWLTTEIQSFWAVRGESARAHLYEQMLLSLAWGAYGAVLIVVGMRRRFAPLRYIGIAIIAITALKVFFYDLWELGGIYRVVGFLGFGVLLVLVSYLYQNRRRVPPRRPDAASDAAADDAATTRG